MRRKALRVPIEEAGASFFEYVVLVALIVASAVAGMTYLGGDQVLNDSPDPGSGIHARLVSVDAPSFP